MSDAQVVAIAKAVTAHLAQQDFSPAPKIERSYADWEQPLEKSPIDVEDKPRLDVVAVTTNQEYELVARGRAQWTVPIDIAVRKRFGAQHQDDDSGRVLVAHVDALMLLVEAVYASLTKKRLPEAANAVWESVRILRTPWQQHLREFKQFTGLVRVTFTVTEAID